MRRNITKRQRQARHYALNYTGKFEFMLSMHQEAIFNDDWYPTPRQADAIFRCKPYFPENIDDTRDKRCAATTKQGYPCKGGRMQGSRFCGPHS